MFWQCNACRTLEKSKYRMKPSCQWNHTKVWWCLMSAMQNYCCIHITAYVFPGTPHFHFYSFTWFVALTMKAELLPFLFSIRSVIKSKRKCIKSILPLFSVVRAICNQLFSVNFYSCSLLVSKFMDVLASCGSKYKHCRTTVEIHSFKLQYRHISMIQSFNVFDAEPSTTFNVCMNNGQCDDDDFGSTYCMFVSFTT